MSLAAAYRGVVLLLWVLAAYDSMVCRGLFWDGASFLANILEHGRFHDFYPARAHVGWVTQAPLLTLIKLGVSDTRLLAMVYSATLFALPTALYHLALARVRVDGVLLATVMVAIAVVYLPTSFFIIGEYNAVYAAATACMAVVLTTDGKNLRDSAILCALGALSLCSYEAMVYLGPLLAAAIVWSTRATATTDRNVRFLGRIAALAFIAAAVVSGATIADYWGHPHFILVRAAILDFWQNPQFTIPLIGLALFAVISPIWPSWFQGRGPIAVIWLTVVVLAASPLFRRFDPEAMLFPPSHYVARQAAGCLLWVLLATMWIHVAWRRNPPAVLINLRQARLVPALFVLVLAAAIPDVTLTGMWTNYLDYFRRLVADRSGVVWTNQEPFYEWPNRLFSQDWSYAALSAIVSRSPGRTFVLPVQDYLSNPPFEPACGLLPRLEGYSWR